MSDPERAVSRSMWNTLSFSSKHREDRAAHSTLGHRDTKATALAFFWAASVNSPGLSFVTLRALSVLRALVCLCLWHIKDNDGDEGGHGGHGDVDDDGHDGGGCDDGDTNNFTCLSSYYTLDTTFSVFLILQVEK